MREKGEISRFFCNKTALSAHATRFCRRLKATILFLICVSRFTRSVTTITKEKIQKFRIQFLQGQVNMMEIVEEYYIIIYNIYIIYNNTTISQSGVWQP